MPNSLLLLEDGFKLLLEDGSGGIIIEPVLMLSLDGSQADAPGSVAGQAFVPGSLKGQANVPGSESGQAC